MHYTCELVIPPTDDVKAAVDEAMSSFIGNDEESRASWLDYYVVGGRWTGRKLKERFPKDRLDAFYAELASRKVTVSGIQFGKQELQPSSQIPEVDALWQEWFPDGGKHCVLFKHSGEDGSTHDVCRVDQLPPSVATVTHGRACDRGRAQQLRWEAATGTHAGMQKLERRRVGRNEIRRQRCECHRRHARRRKGAQGERHWR
jgi:hypothetical protein